MNNMIDIENFKIIYIIKNTKTALEFIDSENNNIL